MRNQRWAGLCGHLTDAAARTGRQSPLPALVPMADPASKQTDVLFNHLNNTKLAVFGEGACELHSNTLLCAIVGRLDWLDMDLADTQLKRGPVIALALAFQKYGETLMEHLAGRFAFVLWDAAQQRGLAAIDRFAQCPLYWRQVDNGVAIASSADMLANAECADLSLQAIYHYLFFHMVPSPDSIYQGIHKLPAAHALRIQAGSAETFCYWLPTFTEQPTAGIRRAGREMRDLLGSAVARLDSGEDTGAFLSGGLDSSSVAGMLAGARGGPVDTYSIGFDAKGYDEMAYARIASKHFGTRAHEYYVTPADVLDALPKVAAAYDEPFGNSSALPVLFCAQMAVADGRKCLLAGDGGDEIFAGNARYAKQKIFEHYSLLPTQLRTGLLEPMLRRFPGDNALVRKARSYVQQANIPLPDRLQSYNFLVRHEQTTILTADLLAAVDREQPWQLERDLYHRPIEASSLNRMLYLDWQHTLADNDLRKVNRMCELAGIRVEYPMLDHMLVEFSTHVPSYRKLPGSRLRDFYKRAVRDFLPQQIIGKSKHGFGLPFGVWLAEDAHLSQLAGDNLQRMRRRGLVREDFVDDLMRLHKETHAGYYGELIWVLVMLELWLSARGYEP